MAASGNQCPPAKDGWSISASLLNVLWGELYPRAVALVWRYPGQWSFPQPGDELQWFVKLLDDHFLQNPVGDPANPGGASFQERLAELRSYLVGSHPKMPIRYWGEGAYDFILSDHGLDLFSPAVDTTKPPGSTDPDQTELYHYYTFRRTGRLPIGLPTVLEGTHRPSLITAPTGPSQISVPLSALVAAQVDLREERCAESVEPSGFRRWVFDEHEGAGRVEEFEDELLVLESLACLECALRRLRCWQLEGSVYRGILEELPRIVATIWWEESASPGGGPPPNLSNYRPRYGRNGDKEHRAIFRERLETSLPDDHWMVFADAGRVPPNPPPPAVFWDANDVMITNRGLIFPELPQKTPTRNDILDAIIQGRAGNPVFTDTAPCWD